MRASDLGICLGAPTYAFSGWLGFSLRRVYWSHLANGACDCPFHVNGVNDPELKNTAQNIPQQDECAHCWRLNTRAVQCHITRCNGKIEVRVMFETGNCVLTKVHIVKLHGASLWIWDGHGTILSRFCVYAIAPCCQSLRSTGSGNWPEVDHGPGNQIAAWSTCSLFHKVKVNARTERNQRELELQKCDGTVIEVAKYSKIVKFLGEFSSFWCTIDECDPLLGNKGNGKAAPSYE